MFHREDGSSNQKTPYYNVTKKYKYIPNNHGYAECTVFLHEKCYIVHDVMCKKKLCTSSYMYIFIFVFCIWNIWISGMYPDIPE